MKHGISSTTTMNLLPSTPYGFFFLHRGFIVFVSFLHRLFSSRAIALSLFAPLPIIDWCFIMIQFSIKILIGNKEKQATGLKKPIGISHPHQAKHIVSNVFTCRQPQFQRNEIKIKSFYKI